MGIGLGLGLPFVSLAGPMTGPHTLFNHQTQTGMTGETDASSYTLGTVFQVSMGGYVTAVHAWRPASASQTGRNAAVWTEGGLLLSSGTVASETSGAGWRSVPQTLPYYLKAGAVIVAATTVGPNGYAVAGSGFSSAVTNKAITALANADPLAKIGNGRLKSGATLTYPDQKFGVAPNYWVDITFSPGAPPALPTGYPDASNTGLTNPSILTPVFGRVDTFNNGDIIQNLDIDGVIVVGHSNVTIRNCRLRSGTPFHAIQVTAGTGLLIEDCEIDGLGTTVNGILGSGTFRRLNIHHVENGINFNNNTTIEDCYIHDMAKDLSSHFDCLECNGGSNILIQRNTLDCNADQTSAVMFNNDFGGLSNITVTANLLMGGAYTCYVDNRFAGGVVDGATIQFTNNKMLPGSFGYFALFTSGAVTSGNTNAYNGAAI